MQEEDIHSYLSTFPFSVSLFHVVLFAIHLSSNQIFGLFFVLFVFSTGLFTLIYFITSVFHCGSGDAQPCTIPSLIFLFCFSLHHF